MARQTKERAEQTRETILDAAVRVFFSRGVARASLEEIAHQAGVTRGAIYWHFRDKLDLFDAIEERLRQPRQDRIDELARSRPTDPLAALEALLTELLLDLCSDERLWMQMTVVLMRSDFVDEMAPSGARQAANHRRIGESLERYFRDAVPPPAPGSDWRPDIAAQVLQTLLFGAILRWLRFPEVFPLRTEGLKTLQAFLTALRSNWNRPS